MPQEPLSDLDTTVIALIRHMRPDVKFDPVVSFVRGDNKTPYLHVDVDEFRRIAQWALNLHTGPHEQVVDIVLLNLASLGFRMQCRVDAIFERDGSEKAAVEGKGVSISYLFARDIARALERARCMIICMRDDIADMKSTVSAFVAVHAVEYAKEHGLPDGHLHPVHYDILEKAGARMTDFTKAKSNDH